MRKITLAAILLGAVLAVSSVASAQTLGFRFGGTWAYPPAVGYYPPGLYAPGFYGAPVVAYPPYPYAYDHSYFRPDGPYGWNGVRNWRDTWQDDGVKIHSYTLH
jgi:hypothetical protein